MDAIELNAADVARRIGDAKHYLRAVGGYGPRHAQRIEEKDPEGRAREVLYLTERGVYKYLMQTRRREAEAFQEYIYEVVEAERQRVVDAARLRARLAEAELAEERARHERTKVAWVLERAEQRREELRAFEKRWGPSAEERAYMGLPGGDEDDWESREDYSQ